jgi:hypothetical protein
MPGLSVDFGFDARTRATGDDVLDEQVSPSRVTESEPTQGDRPERLFAKVDAVGVHGRGRCRRAAEIGRRHRRRNRDADERDGPQSH